MARRHFGFTLIEVLVVVALLLLLIAILLPSLPTGPRRARRTVCLMNLKAGGSAFAIAASTNRGVWPASKAKLDSLCQQTVETRDALGGGGSKVFYCPLNAAQDPAVLWTRPGGVSTWGYVWFNDRGAAGAGLPAVFPSRSVPLQYLSTLDGRLKQAAKTILALDAVVTDTATPPLNYTPKGTAVAFGTSHVPAGKGTDYQNVLFADGHVDSVKFEASKAAAIAEPGGGFFWVPEQ